MVGNCTRCAHAGAAVSHSATSALAKQPKMGEWIAFKLGTEYKRWDSALGSGVFKAALNNNPGPAGQGQPTELCASGWPMLAVRRCPQLQPPLDEPPRDAP